MDSKTVVYFLKFFLVIVNSGSGIFYLFFHRKITIENQLLIF